MANEKILVVEDDQAVASLIALFLKRCGYDVAACAATGEDALAQTERARPNLALMDINLGGELDGVQTAERLRARFDVPVVFLTGLADDETIRRSRKAKAFGYLLKPFRQEDLKSSIDLALNKHQVESKLRRVEHWFTAAIKSVGEAVITTDEAGKLTFLNPVAETLTGWEAEDAQGRPLKQVFSTNLDCPAGDSSAVLSSDQAVLVSREGATLPIEFSVAPIRNDAGLLVGRVLVFRDISERRRAEEELRRSRGELRLLAAHVERVREEERKHIAREVHDELGQKITGLRMDLSWMEKRLPAISDTTTREALSSKARSMFELLDQMVKTVRKVSAELRPGVLDDLGLVAAIEWQARDWQARAGIECHVKADVGELAACTERDTAVFRIFQEALTNVARHAGASKVMARLRSEDGWLIVEIADNGRGITKEDRRRAKSFGLLGMNERAGLLGGACEVQGTPGQGTIVRLKLPLKGGTT